MVGFGRWWWLYIYIGGCGFMFGTISSCRAVKCCIDLKWGAMDWLGHYIMSGGQWQT